MIGLNLVKAPTYLLERINNIYTLLRQVKKQYERVALNLTDKDLRRSMLSLAQESNQYACELSSQMQTLGGTPGTEKMDQAEVKDEMQNVDKELIKLCQKNEAKMVWAYREILNDSLSYEELSKMVRYQLKEMLCAFRRVQEIASLKIHNTALG